MNEGQPKRMDQDAAQRAQAAAALRVAGLPWHEVAAQTGYSAATHAARAVRNYLGSIPAPDRASSKELLRLRAEVVWRQVAEDMRAGRPGATRAAIALLGRMAALDGLDDPTTVALVDPTLEQREAILRAALAGSPSSRAVEADPFAEEYLEAEVVENEVVLLPGATGVGQASTP